MPSHYQFIFRDGTGSKIGQLAGSDGAKWLSCAYDHTENGVGRATLVVDGGIDFLGDLTDRAFIEIRRRVELPTVSIPWYTEWSGMLDFINDRTVNDVNTVQLEFASYLDLIRARVVKYNPSTAYDYKSGPGETVIKALVEENAGPSATAPPRYCNGVQPGLTVEADLGRGDPWEGSHAGSPLLDTITKVGNSTGMFFDVVATAPATFEFQCYHLQRGLNCARIGVDKTTGGLNLYGNPPVTFSLENQNMENPSLQTNWRDSISAVTMLGMGSDDDTLYECRLNATDTSKSPWSTRETLMRANNDYSANSLLYAANEAIIANRAKTTLSFDVVQVESCLYGLDYSWGYVVTALYKDVEYTKRVASVGVQVTPHREVIRPVLLDVR